MIENLLDTKSPEQKEYNFDEGVSVIVEKIESLLQSGQKYVIVSINGSGIDVGKTKLTSEISINLQQKVTGTLVLTCSNADNIDTLKDILSMDTKQKIPKKQVVIIFGADHYTGLVLPKKIKEKVRESADKSLKKNAAAIGLGVDKIDLRIGIFRPDRPFKSIDDCEVFADIIIKNEKAHNKK